MPTFVGFQTPFSDNPHIHIDVAKVTAVSGMDGAGQSLIHVVGGESFQVLASPEDVRACIAAALKEEDDGVIEK